MRAVLPLLSALACRREVDLTCALDPDNALRLRCEANLREEAPVTLRFGREGQEPDRSLSSAEPLLEHTFDVAYLAPESRYAFSAQTPSGESDEIEIETGALPATFPRVSVTGTQGSSSEGMRFLMSCAGPYAIELSAAGEIVWYQDLAAGLADEQSHRARAMSIDADGEITALLDQSLIRRFSEGGELLFEVNVRDLGLESPLHHDLVRSGDLVYLLFAETYEVSGQLYVLDGLYLLDAYDGRHVATWALADHVVPEGLHGGTGYWDLRFPNADDWSHANSLLAEPDRSVWVSFYNLDSVIQIDGDPASASFGDIALAVAGDARSPFVPSESAAEVLAVTDPDDRTDDETFSYAHHPGLVPFEGRTVLTLFDNGPDTMSRVLALDLQHTPGQAVVAGSWGVGYHCPIEGSVYRLQSGRWLATCPSERAILEIEPSTGEIAREVKLSCTTSDGGLLPRVIPVPR